MPGFNSKKYDWMKEAGYPPNAEGWTRFKTEHEKAGTWGPAKRLHDKMKFVDGITDFTARFAEMLKQFPTDGLEPRFRERPPAKPEKVNVSKPKKGSIRISDVAVMKWVFENLGQPDLKPEDAPSAGAWQLLRDCEAEPKIRQEFRGKWLQAVMKKEDSQVSEKDVRHESELDRRLLEFERAG